MFLPIVIVALIVALMAALIVLVVGGALLESGQADREIELLTPEDFTRAMETPVTISPRCEPQSDESRAGAGSEQSPKNVAGLSKETHVVSAGQNVTAAGGIQHPELAKAAGAFVALAVVIALIIWAVN